MNLQQSVKDSLWGFTTSALAVAATYPADTLSKRLQVSTTIKANWWKGLYKGLMPALGTQPVYWAINMPLYNGFKALSPIELKNHFAWNMFIGFSAGAIATVTTNPLWMLRQRMQTELLKNKQNSYTSLIRELYAEDGLRTFFRGTSVTLVKNIQMALLLPLFERINNHEIWKTWNVSPVVATGLSAATAKIIASTGVYPLDVIRTNIRYVERKKVNIAEVTRQIIRSPGGFANLFRGIGWYWMSAAGTFAVMQGLQSLQSLQSARIF